MCVCRHTNVPHANDICMWKTLQDALSAPSEMQAVLVGVSARTFLLHFFRVQIIILDSTHLHCCGIPHARFKIIVSWITILIILSNSTAVLSGISYLMAYAYIMFQLRMGIFIRCLFKFMASSYELTRVTMTERAVYKERERERSQPEHLHMKLAQLIRPILHDGAKVLNKKMTTSSYQTKRWRQKNEHNSYMDEMQLIDFCAVSARLMMPCQWHVYWHMGDWTQCPACWTGVTLPHVHSIEHAVRAWYIYIYIHIYIFISRMLAPAFL